jgi:hypothetical protein
MYDVKTNVIDPEMRLLMTSGRYQNQKDGYETVAEKADKFDKEDQEIRG